MVAIADAHRVLSMKSWHELFESKANHLVATSHGVEVLYGRSRKKVLRSQPEDYKRFRRAWKDTRDKLAGFIPREGQLAEELHFKLQVIPVRRDEQ